MLDVSIALQSAELWLPVIGTFSSGKDLNLHSNVFMALPTRYAMLNYPAPYVYTGCNRASYIVTHLNSPRDL